MKKIVLSLLSILFLFQSFTVFAKTESNQKNSAKPGFFQNDLSKNPLITQAGKDAINNYKAAHPGISTEDIIKNLGGQADGMCGKICADNLNDPPVLPSRIETPAEAAEAAAAEAAVPPPAAVPPSTTDPAATATDPTVPPTTTASPVSSAASSGGGGTKVTVTEEIPGMGCKLVSGSTVEDRQYECTIKKGFGSVMDLLSWLIKYVTLIAILISVLMLVISGIRMSIEGKKDEAKKTFYKSCCFNNCTFFDVIHS